MDRYWETEKCPRCGEALETETYKDYRDSTVLMPIWEELTVWFCPACGWNDRD